MGQPQPPHPVVFNVGGKAAKQILLGGALAGGIGILTIVATLTGQITGGPVAQVIGWVIGLVFTGIGVFCAVMWKAAARPRRLVFDVNGITWDDPRGKPWAVRWDELAGVAISRTRQRRVEATDYAMRNVLVRLDLFPGDPQFQQRHRDMEHLWEYHRVKNGYRLPLGHAPEYVPLIDQAMRQFRPQIYGGIRDEGVTIGLR